MPGTNSKTNEFNFRPIIGKNEKPFVFAVKVFANAVIRDIDIFMKIAPGESAIIVMHSPREKLLGILDEINQSGVHIRAIDLGYFDDWCRSIAEDEPYLPMSDYFLPMWRIERLIRDEGSNGTPSMAELFESRTGRPLGEF